MSESQIQSAYFEILQLNARKYPMLTTGIFAVANGGKRHITTAVRLKKEGVKAGVWDVCICIPTTSPGAWIEFKMPKNKLTPSQERFLEHLENFGYQYAVCHSVDEAIEFTEKYLKIRLVK